MKITKSYDISYDLPNSSISIINAEGSIYKNHDWLPIETSIIIYKKTEKAYFGDVIVYLLNDLRRVGILFEKLKTWIPKSMSDNPWWICTVMFEYKKKVANKRFEDDFW